MDRLDNGNHTADNDTLLGSVQGDYQQTFAGPVRPISFALE